MIRYIRDYCRILKYFANTVGNKWQACFDEVLAWRQRHLSDKQFTLLLAFLVGAFAAIAAYILHSLIHCIQSLVMRGIQVESYNWLYLVLPVVGIWLTMLFVKYVVRDNISHGITRILYAISSKRSRLARHNCWSSVVASAITIGFGGSVGAEAPIVLTGSSIASNLGQSFRMNNKTLMLLVGCGAAAAIAGIFKAPIAGLVFTIEVLMIDLTMASISPILIASVTATCFTYVLVGDDKLFSFNLVHPWAVERVPSNILLGVFCGLVSLYFIRMMTACEGVFGRMSNAYSKLAFGGVLLSTLIFIFPSLYGEGYSSINILLDNRTEMVQNRIMENSMFYGGGTYVLLLYLAGVILTKCFATASTNGGGGCGGTFAPSLFIGAFAGFLFARLWNIYNVGPVFPEENAALLGMAGVMSGVMHAPLTGVFLIAELTAGYDLFMPLMIVSVCAYLTILAFEPHSIYGMRLARQGKLITHHTDRSVLTLMTLDTVIEREFVSVDKDMELVQLVHALSKSHSSVLPVLDAAGNLLGEIDLDKLRHIVFRTELYHHFRVSQLMMPPVATLRLGDPMEDVMRAFDEYNTRQLPVMDAEGHLYGYISRSHLLSQYRKMVADMSND
ncbi:MAG: chloride channel protein [Prevotellaceae bacterium]|nr:chloride channel protein [Prevotellaceae bacterium]MDO4931402.1 chloride channel protein [Prevotellaceae bacterium]